MGVRRLPRKGSVNISEKLKPDYEILDNRHFRARRQAHQERL
jgi:hypothetical protein